MDTQKHVIPGEIIFAEGDIEINAGRDVIKLVVANTGDRPIQIGSHIHFAEVNRQLMFDRRKAIGRHLNIPAGTAVRFEPGQETEVELVEIGGRKQVFGVANLTNGPVNRVDEILEVARQRHYKGAE